MGGLWCGCGEHVAMSTGGTPSTGEETRTHQDAGDQHAATDGGRACTEGAGHGEACSGDQGEGDEVWLWEIGQERAVG